ncbi:MAG: GGDEF domain-containing protein [Roseibium sp.]
MTLKHLYRYHRFSVLAAGAGTLALFGIVWIALDTLIGWQVQESIKSSAEQRAKVWAENFLATTPSAVSLIQTGRGTPDQFDRLAVSFTPVNIIKFALFNHDGVRTYTSTKDQVFQIDADGKARAAANARLAFQTGEPVVIIHQDDNDEISNDLRFMPETFIEAYIPAITLSGQKVGTFELYIDASAYKKALEKTFQKVSLYLVLGTVLVLLVPIAAFVRRTQQLMQNDKRLLELTRFDQLTGVFNRNSISQHLSAVFDSPQEQNSVGILFIDIDYFKQVNDQYGHATGDKLLQHIARILKASVRSKNDIVGRYGGDEFIIICPDISLKDFRKFYGRIMEGAKTPYHNDTSSHAPSLSIGAFLTSPEDNQKTALHRADLAVYAAKHRGRNQVVEYSSKLEDLFADGDTQQSA